MSTYTLSGSYIARQWRRCTQQLKEKEAELQSIRALNPQMQLDDTRLQILKHRERSILNRMQQIPQGYDKERIHLAELGNRVKVAQ